MKAYKGFNKDLTCRGYQYEEGKEYHEEKASLCNVGFHACEAPLDTFGYYAPGTSVYHEVELEGVSDKRRDDTKVVGKSIKIGERLDTIGICKAQFDYVKAHATAEHTDSERATAGHCGAATAGDYGAATAGDYGAATAGHCGAATAGECGTATTGDCGAATAGNRGAATAGYRGSATAGNHGAATAGNRGAATAGYRGAATAGYRGAATAGYRGAATTGDYGAATSRGSVSVGASGIASVRGNNAKARGGMDAVFNIVIEENDSFEIKEWKTGVVDGKVIKADTWYTLRDGEFVEV